MPDNKLPDNNLPDNGGVWPPPIGSPPDAYNTQAAGLPARHGCLTAWLVFGLIAQTATVGIYSLGYPFVHRTLPGFTPLAAGLLVLAGLGSIVCLTALFQWRRWGFYGMAVITILVGAVNLSLGISPGRVLPGLLGIGILYWVLNMGGSRSAWRNMK